MKPEIKERIAQIRRGEVPSGYQRTKVGVVPCDWGITRFHKMFSRLRRKNTEGNENVLTISAQYGLVSQEEFFTKSVASEDKSNYFLLYQGDFTYNKSYSNGYPFGAIKPLVRYDKGVVSPLYICFSRTEANKYPNFYAHYFEGGYLNREIKAIAQEGARNHGLLNISIDDFFNANILAPPLEEQRRIAEILTTQDKIIALKERRLAEKRRQKTFLAQRLLTGKTRLPGFDGEWKTERLGALFAERVETKREDLELLAITASQGVIPRSRLDLKDNSSEDKSKYLRVCVGDIGYNTMRMWQGVSAYSNYEGIVSPAYTVLKPSADVCAKYFAYLFKTPKIVFLFYRHSQGLVDDTRNLKYANFKKISIVYPPNLEEQQAIAEVLTCADREIEALQRDLELEKRKKKASMQLLLTGVVRVNSRRRSA